MLDYEVITTERWFPAQGWSLPFHWMSLCRSAENASLSAQKCKYSSRHDKHSKANVNTKDTIRFSLMLSVLSPRTLMLWIPNATNRDCYTHTHTHRYTCKHTQAHDTCTHTDTGTHHPPSPGSLPQCLPEWRLGLKLGSEDSITASFPGQQRPSGFSPHCCLPDSTSAGSWRERQSQCMNAGAPTREAGVSLQGPNTCSQT